MLKEFWRKLGSDFLQAEEPPQANGSSQANGFPDECRESAPGLYESDDFRILPHITHTGEFHLERLISLLESRYGKSTATAKSFSEACEAGHPSVRDLIAFAARVQDQDIQRELLLLYLNCSPVIQEYLRSDEVLGASHFLSR